VSAPIRFSVQAGVGRGGRDWLDLARRVEASGFDTLHVADHPGATGSPFTSLAAAAAVTTTLKLGTYVCNAGVRGPVELASDAATLDVISNGRLVLGLGAGHTPAEWTMEGRTYPGPADRVARLGEMVEVVMRLLAGEVVSFGGKHVHVSEAFLLAPRPVQKRVPLLLGGNGMQLLRIAARTADIVSLTGLGRTLDDGHRHTVDWSASAIDTSVARVRASGRPIVIDALVQHVELTDQPADAGARVAGLIPGLDPRDLHDAPFVWIGSVDGICEQLLAAQERWGFTSYVVRENALDAASAIMARLS
jgi:probable F420-dependent oxidoreductase